MSAPVMKNMNILQQKKEKIYQHLFTRIVKLNQDRELSAPHLSYPYT